MERKDSGTRMEFECFLRSTAGSQFEAKPVEGFFIGRSTRKEEKVDKLSLQRMGMQDEKCDGITQAGLLVKPASIISTLP